MLIDGSVSHLPPLLRANAGLNSGCMIAHVAHSLAIAWLCAAQGVDFLRPLRSSQPLEQAQAVLRAAVPSMPTDRHIAPDIEAASALVHAGALTGSLCALPAGEAPGALPPLWVAG